MSETEILEEEELSGRGRLKEEDMQDLEIPIPAGFDVGKIEDLKERREKTIKKINEIMKGSNIVKKTPSFVFSFYTPKKEEERKVGDRWEEDGYEWEQRNGYKIRLPKIDREDIGGLDMPTFCPVCKTKRLKHWLDIKMWKVNGRCMDCTAAMENEMILNGTYKEYERQRIMANIRSFYYDVKTGLEDYINSLDATYVNAEGEIERWDKVNKPMIRSMILNDLRLLAESFAENFGEPLENKDGMAS